MNKLIRGIMCVLIAACVLEVCARVDDYLTDGAPLAGPYGYGAMLTHDDDGVIGKPYAHYRKWKLNSQGYRGPDIRWDRERIICIGASETFGFTESEGMEFPRQLERELNRRIGYERYQIVNVAYAGQSVGSFSRRADKVAAAVRPNIALIYPSSSSYLDLSSRGGDPVEWVREKRAFESRVRGKFFDWVDTMPEWAQECRSKVHIWKETHRTGTIARVADANLIRFREDLDRLFDRLQRRHIEPVLVTHATRFGNHLQPEDRPMLTIWRRFAPALQESGFLDFENRFNDVIRREGIARHLLVIDAASHLSGRSNFADFAHFTDQGARAMANLIAGPVLESEKTGSRSQAPVAEQVLSHSRSRGTPSELFSY
jgi:hypothetical protein